MSTTDTLHLPDNSAILMLPDNTELFEVPPLATRTYGSMENMGLTYGQMEAYSYAGLEVIM